MSAEGGEECYACTYTCVQDCGRAHCNFYNHLSLVQWARCRASTQTPSGVLSRSLAHSLAHPPSRSSPRFDAILMNSWCRVLLGEGHLRLWGLS